MAVRDLEKIMNSIISKSFLELESVPIELKQNGARAAFMNVIYEPNINAYVISVNKRLTDPAPLNAIKGGFAHELSYILVDKTIGKKPGSTFYKRTKVDSYCDEVTADVYAILRGYGSHLLEMINYLKTSEGSENTKYTWYSGLTTPQIEKLIGEKRIPKV
ncbi:MAG: hypothetical protein Q8O89_09080 [Nanoarchaeota archaeon]|nr:hypothetical protein [Nanoarchaeota archaeon]